MALFDTNLYNLDLVSSDSGRLAFEASAFRVGRDPYLNLMLLLQDLV